MNLISASRRTDLPAFYWRWFMNRVRDGSCDVANPFAPRQVRRVSLRPEDVAGIVFWTRDARPMLPDVGGLERAGFSFYVQYTINGYPRELEPGAPEPSLAIETLRELCECTGPERVVWRYDPIILSTRTPPSYHTTRFSQLARELSGYAHDSTISFCDPYAKTIRALARLDGAGRWGFRFGELEERRAIVRDLAETAQASGLSLCTCAEEGLDLPGVERGRCVDASRFPLSASGPHASARPARIRHGCSCDESVDIGAYDTCTYGCIYCYANRSAELARRRRANHEQEAKALGLYQPRDTVH